MEFSWVSCIRITVLLLLIGAITTTFFALPIEKMLKNFLIWVEQDLGHWGPLVLAVAYVPLTVLAVPASVLTLGGGYLYGLPVGFLADSLGSVMGATAAFLFGRTIGRSYVIVKIKDYPKFRDVAIAIERSGFKIVFLLRLVPLLPYNMMNYLLSVTPVLMWEYVLASWLGMMPITLALVYVGTNLKDLSDITHGWHEFSPSHWAFLVSSIAVSVIVIACVTRVAKAALDRALDENENIDGLSSPKLSLSTLHDDQGDLQQPLIVKMDSC